MKCALCTIAALAALTSLLAGCSSSPASHSKDSTPTPAFAAAGALPLQADATLVLTGENMGELDFAVPALVDGIAVPVEFALAGDPHAQIIDQAGNEIPLTRQAAYIINAREVWHVKGWHIEARRADGGLVFTRLEPALSPELKAARERPDVVVHGLLAFNANGVAQLRGVVNGLYYVGHGRLGGAWLDVPLLLDGVAGSARFDLAANRRTMILDATGAKLPASALARALDKLVGSSDLQTVTTVRRLGSHRLAIVTLQLPFASVAAEQ
jgi:hypothetical protein